MHSLGEVIGRRRALLTLGGSGIASLIGGRDQSALGADLVACVPSTPQVTEGPYWIDEKLFRSDIRTDPTTGIARPGVPLSLTINVQNSGSGACVPLTGAYVDIWHCDATGLYSDEAAYNPGGGVGTVVTSGQKFLRGYQITDDNGQVKFITIYPGWYGGRTIHIHVRVRTYSGSTLLDNYVTQLFFDDTVSNAVLTQAAYVRSTARDTTNTNDGIYRGAQNASRMLLSLNQADPGYAGEVTLGVTMKSAATGAPAVSAGGIANSASGAAGLAPGTWVSIYGSNLASAARELAASDIVNGVLPTSLGGVSVQVNGKAAYPRYVSTSQVDVLTPDDAGIGSVAVTVTNAAGTSAAVTAAMQTIMPGIFTTSGFVREAAAAAGDTIEIYGTGFGPSTYTGSSGQVFSGAWELTNPATVTIGGTPATVAWAGQVGPGLYQLNVTVPALAGGNQPVVVTVANSASPAAWLKIA